MQFLKKALSALLVAAMALVMLTACVPAGSEPPASSKPDNSIGGSTDTTPGGDAETPDETPKQEVTWATSKTRAYFKQRGVTATDFFISTGDISMEINYGLEFHAKIVTRYAADGSMFGYFTGGSETFVFMTDPQTGDVVAYSLYGEILEQFGEEIVAQMAAEADLYFYLLELRLKVIDDTADRVVAFQTTEYENGYYAEKITLADGWTYIYTYNTLGELVAITSSSVTGYVAQTYLIEEVTRSELAIFR